MKSPVDKDYIKSAVKGLVVGHICLGVAATAALLTIVTVGWTQFNFLVSWVPVILTAVFLAVTTLLLRKDMGAQKRQRNSGDN